MFAVGSSKPLVHSQKKGFKQTMEGDKKKQMRDEHENLDDNKGHSSCQRTSNESGRDKTDTGEDSFFLSPNYCYKFMEKDTQREDNMLK